MTGVQTCALPIYYINYVKNQIEGTEYSNRIRYIINNYEDFDAENRSQPDYRLKVGPSLKYLYALNQIDLTITIPVNMDINAGDVIYCDLPEVHGFNIIEAEKYISGLFIVNEVKHIINVGQKASTSLRIYKDGYLNSLIDSSLYTTATQRGGDVIDPATGRLVGRGGV